MASERERPSRHGKICGEMLADLADAGRRALQVDMDVCGTCAFRRGSMPNMMAATGLEAMNTVLGIDPDDFACHHGMKDGRPTKLCAGYLLAKAAPWPEVKARMSKMKDDLAAMSGPDEVRAAFDAWIEQVDPHHTMDDYQRGRAWARARHDASGQIVRPEGERSE